MPALLESSLDRLNTQLPLAARQRSLATEIAALHRAILRSLYETGVVPTGVPDSAVAVLASKDLVVLAKGSMALAGAYPMTTEPTPHLLVLPGRTVHAMCALDALSVTPMFGGEVEIRSQCRVTGEPVVIHQRDETILDASPSGALVGVRWQMPCGSHAAHSMCMEMVFLRDHDTALSWSQGNTANHSVFTLPEAVEFGARFFKPLVKAE